MAGDTGPLTLLRWSVPLAVGLPGIIKYLIIDGKHIMHTFDHTVAPLVDAAVSDPAQRKHVKAALLGTTMKIGLAMRGYSTIAKIPFDTHATVLGGSYTRIYDDLIDNFECGPHQDLDERLAGLFHGKPFTPTSEMEQLLLTVYTAIEDTLQRQHDDPLHQSMRELHDYQRQSRRQRDSRLSPAEIAQITQGKGGLAVVALFALLRPAMTLAERELVMELGDVLQLLDDHHDFPLDLAQDITTSVTLGQSTLVPLVARIRKLRSRFRRFYGSDPTTLWAMLHLMAFGAVLIQRRHHRYLPTRQSTPTKLTPTRLLLGRAQNIRRL